MTKEEDLYEPIRRALIGGYSKRESCQIWVTADGITEEAKEILNREAVYILEAEKQRPDLLGSVASSPNAKHERPNEILVVEVKKGAPALKDIYQLKRYAEVLSVDYAFLISEKRFPISKRQFLIANMPILGFGKCLLFKPAKWISVMLLKNGRLSCDKDLTHVNPFATTALEIAFS